jgi:hypothetical protein
MTRATTEEEAARLFEGLTYLCALNVPVFVTDNSQHPSLALSIETLPNLHFVRERSGMVPRICNSLRRAAAERPDVIIYTEPDKLSFFRTGINQLLTTAGQNPSSLVIAARDECSFATIPSGQRMLESMTRQIVSCFLGHDIDLQFGPFAMPCPAVERYLPQVRTEFGWGWRTYLIARCLMGGEPLVVCEGRFPAPEWNRHEDDGPSRLYRLQQFIESVEGIRQGILSSHKPSSPGRRKPSPERPQIASQADEGF